MNYCIVNTSRVFYLMLHPPHWICDRYIAWTKQLKSVSPLVISILALFMMMLKDHMSVLVKLNEVFIMLLLISASPVNWAASHKNSNCSQSCAFSLAITFSIIAKSRLKCHISHHYFRNWVKKRTKRDLLTPVIFRCHCYHWNQETMRNTYKQIHFFKPTTRDPG